ncbi:DUF1972 domain-containing protein [Comamonas sp. NLF-1-9]|uniref:DUF1972 domain-containing protein n=1 Tax=Comamonas sp. NLF-1-9 TaxID=2853163 RepID=UPI001C45C040|nr:DUF1972 domain-containing protein [Comamonas sp. NLF-1-9]QXL83559.1 DUF1972 domain-containing protein [Comamonas sp. NLF-1-9]
MHIAILGTRGIPASYGGFETFAEQLATRLVQRGMQVTVYAEADSAGLQDTWYHGVRIRHIQRPRWGAASVIGYDCRCLRDARAGYDLIYMLGYGAAWACWWNRRVHGQTVWLNVDGLEWARSKWGRMARLYLRTMEWVSSWAPTRVLADAQAIAEHYARRYPRGSPCSFIAYGADVPVTSTPPTLDLSSWGLCAGQYVLVVARAEPENHLLEIVQGHASWAGDWPLVIVGDVQQASSAYQQRLRALAGDKVRFVGPVYDARALTNLRLGAACHVHGHSVGGTNPSLLEALACGNLVVAHDNPFNREVARDAAQYFHTPAQLARALSAVHKLSAQARRAASRRARNIVIEDYSWDRIVKQYEALMHSDIDRARRSEASR